MKVTSLIRVNMIIAMSLFATIALSQNKLDTTAIQNILQGEVIAWNNGDATAYSKHFAEEGTLGSNVAIVETLTWLSGFSKEGPPPGTHLDDKGRLYTRLLQIMAKNGTDWEIMTYHNVDLKPGTIVPK